MSNIKWNIAQRLEIRWWRRYLKDKNATEYLDWKRNYWLQFFDHAKPYLENNPQMRNLDAGCGPSGINMILPNKVIALDPLLDQYESIEVFQQVKMLGAQFEKGTIETFVSDEKFDLVCCLNVINHVQDIQKAMKNLHTLTTSGGNLLLSIDAHKHAALKHLFRAIPGDALHPHQFDLNEYIQLGVDVGFTLKHTVLIKRESIFDYYLLIFFKP